VLKCRRTHTLIREYKTKLLKNERPRLKKVQRKINWNRFCIRFKERYCNI